MKLDEFFRCVGGGYGEAKARFQNDERIVRFLNMFPGDDSMQNLTNAMNTGDATTAFRAVHTLKGVALNLGLGSLAHASSQMTEALRARAARKVIENKKNRNLSVSTFFTSYSSGAMMRMPGPMSFRINGSFLRSSASARTHLASVWWKSCSILGTSGDA